MYKKLCFIIILSFSFYFLSCKYTPLKVKEKVVPDTISIEQQYNCFVDGNICYYFDHGVHYTGPSQDKVGTVSNTEEANVWCIYNEYVYFSTENHEIFRVKINGQEFEFLCHMTDYLSYDTDSVSEILVSENYVFVRLGISLYLYDISEKEVLFISSDARNLSISKNKLYFSGRDCSIHEFDFQTKEEKFLFQSDYSAEQGYFANLYKNFIFVDDELYYYLRIPDGLYCFDGKSCVQISDDSKINEFSLCVYQGELYFLTRKDMESVQMALMKYEPKNGEIVKLLVLENYARDMKIIDGYLYYKNSDMQLVKVELPEKNNNY